MTELDPAGLVVIAGRALGIGPDAALAQIDLGAAQAALAKSAQCAPADRDEAAAAGIGLVDALLRHRPFPRHNEPVAVAAALQFLSLNGWRADLDSPAAAAVVVEALAAGQLSPGRAAAWFAPQLSPSRVPRARLVPVRLPRPALRVPRLVPAGAPAAARTAASVMVTGAVGGLALLAAACARGPVAPAAHPAGRPPSYVACPSQHASPGLPRPVASGSHAAPGPAMVSAAGLRLTLRGRCQS